MSSRSPATDLLAPLAAAEGRPWQALDIDARALNPVRSMITPDESRYLYWLARDVYEGRGTIVDLGPLLGGSTVTLATGLQQNARIPAAARRGCIHSYDLFEYAPYMSGLFDEPGPRPGESLLPRFTEATAPWRETIHVYPGDVQRQAWTGGPIEILFIDLAKTWNLQRHLLREFFPHLIPGRSIIVQQDYFFHGAPWIHVVMEYLRDYVTPVHMTDGPSLGFAVTRPIPPDLLDVDYERRFSRGELTDLMDRAAARFDGAKRLVVLTAKATLLALRDEVDEAVNVLEAVRRSPAYDPARVSFDFERATSLVLSRCAGALPATAGAMCQRPLSTDEETFVRALVTEAGPDAVLTVGAPTDTAPRWHACQESLAWRDVLYASSRLAGRRFSFVVLDDVRHHPLPTAVLLALLPMLAAGAWVVLRHVRLPLFDTNPLAGHGTRHLFDRWPGETRRAPHVGDVGAIRLPAADDAAGTRGLVALALQQTWEVLPPTVWRDTLGLSPASAGAAHLRGLERMQRATESGRPLYVWGAGQSGQMLLTLLAHHEVPVAGIVDRNPLKQGTAIGPWIVAAPETLERSAAPRPFVGFTGMFADEIAEALRAAGWQRETDYAAV